MANESALKDGNRVPTLLFEEAGETRRVSPARPLPVSDVGGGASIKTALKEVATNQGVQTVLTPPAGKKIVVRGVAILHEPATGGEATLSFQGGAMIYRTYRADHSGNYVPMNVPGNVNQAITGQITSGTGSNRALFLVNYVEE